MDGTQGPTKRPCSSEPGNQRDTDSRKDNIAAARIDILTTFNLEFILLNSITLHRALPLMQAMPKLNTWR
jgi:hypothetical protein